MAADIAATIKIDQLLYRSGVDFTLDPPSPTRNEIAVVSISAVGKLLCLRARKLDHFGPLFGFVGYELAEVGGRYRQRRAAHLSNSRLDLGIGETGINLNV
jgi:hypothetical protein